MERIFLTIVNMSITASLVLIVLLLLRMALRCNGTPKWMICTLWAVVFFRLLCPITFISNYSLLQLLPQEPHIQAGIQMEYVTEEHYIRQLTDQTMQTSARTIEPKATEEVTAAEKEPQFTAQHSAQQMIMVLGVLPYLWLTGLMIIAVYHGYRWYHLRRQIETATLVDNHIYESDKISGPFVLGLWRPKIYLPLGLAGEQRQFILWHEQSHIQRGDLWWKTLSQLALLLHWFNPLVYLACYLFEQDLEQACDEKVLAQLGSAKKVDYCQILLAMSVDKQHLVIPLAFGESKTKQRIQNILQYRKPATTAFAMFFLIAVMIVISCSSNPADLQAEENGPAYTNWTKSMMQQVYWNEQQHNLTKIYQILLPDNPLQLEYNIHLRKHDESEKQGIFIIYTKNYRQFQQEEQALQLYLLAAMTIYDLQEGAVEISYSTSSLSSEIFSGTNDLSELLEQLPESFSVYQQGEAGLKRLLEQLQVEQAEEKAKELWQVRQHMEQEKQQYQVIKDTFSFYDVQCSTIGWSNDWGQQPYVLCFNIDKTNRFFEQRKSKLDYQKAALLLFAQYPDLQEVEFWFWGSVASQSNSLSALLVYDREELEQIYGSLQLTEQQPITQQMQTLLNRAHAYGEPEKYSQPQLEFYDTLRQIDFEVLGYHTNMQGTAVRFSLLPDQQPVDDGCYLRIHLVTTEDKNGGRTLVEGSSSLWIYGQQADWQQIGPPVLQWETANAEICELTYHGKYRIVVSRWDRALRQALEDLGGVKAENSPSPWVVVYSGRLTFQQQLPQLCFT